jgi:O-antigen ligase
MACLVGLGAMAFVGMTRRGPVSALAASYVAGVAALAAGVVAAVQPSLLLALLGKDATLTGRTKIWAAVGRRMAEQPVTGYGFGAVWSNEDLWAPLAKISKEQGFKVGEAHNAWLEVGLDLGIVGVACAALFFLSVVIGIVRRFGDRAVYLALPFAAIFAISSLTEANIFVQNDWTWMLAVAMAARLAQPRDARSGAGRARAASLQLLYANRSPGSAGR